jgi:hypothetical protein
MMRWVPIVFAAWLVGSMGCRQGTEEPPPASDIGNLRGIANVYALAQRNLGRPPKDVEELKAILAPAMEDPASVFRSQRDGEEFVIVWGLDLMGRDVNSTTPIAYERKGVDGKRMVLNTRGEVSELTNEEFARLKFPPGHKQPGG